MRRLLFALSLWTLVAGCDVSQTLSIPGASSPSSPVISTSDGQTGAIRVYFTRPESSPDDPNNIARVLARIIEQAQKTIDVCAFELDNRVVTDALVQAVRRGVRVRLVTETNYIEEHGVQALRAAGVPVIDDQREGALMHNKFMVFDNQSVWTGSMNFTENCAYRNNNHGLWIGDVRIAANYVTKFQWMFEQRKFGGLPQKTARIPNPSVRLDDGTVIENYFSTHDRVAEKVIMNVDQARSSIHFLAFSFTHDGIGEAMLRRSVAGTRVQGVFERTQAAGGHTEYPRFRSAGGTVQVFLDANVRNMHHKVILLDGETMLAGSFNFSEGADKQNDENLVVIRNREIARRFEEEFQRLFANAKQAEERN